MAKRRRRVRARGMVGPLGRRLGPSLDRVARPVHDPDEPLGLPSTQVWRPGHIERRPYGLIPSTMCPGSATRRMAATRQRHPRRRPRRLRRPRLRRRHRPAAGAGDRTVPRARSSTTSATSRRCSPPSPRPTPQRMAATVERGGLVQLMRELPEPGPGLARLLARGEPAAPHRPGVRGRLGRPRRRAAHRRGRPAASASRPPGWSGPDLDPETLADLLRLLLDGLVLHRGLGLDDDDAGAVLDLVEQPGPGRARRRTARHPHRQPHHRCGRISRGQRPRE